MMVQEVLDLAMVQEVLDLDLAMVLVLMTFAVLFTNVSAMNARKTLLSAMTVNKDWKLLIIVDVLTSAVLLKEFADSTELMFCPVLFGNIVFVKHAHVMEPKQTMMDATYLNVRQRNVIQAALDVKSMNPLLDNVVVTANKQDAV